MEKILLLFQICSQLTGTSVTVLGGGYFFTGLGGSQAWEEAKVRAEEAGVSLKLEDYRPAKLPKEDRLLAAPDFQREIEAPPEDRLKSWDKLPEVTRKHAVLRLNPAIGYTTRYRDFFTEKLTEEEAREKLAGMAEPFEKRLEKVTEVLLAKPKQAVYAELDITDQEAASDYLIGFQHFLGSYESATLMALRSGKPAKALRMMKALEQLSGSFSGSNLIGALVERAGRNRVDALIWEGIRVRVWNDEQLKQIEQVVAQREFVEECKRTFSYELAWMIDLLEDPEKSEGYVSFGAGGRAGDLIFHWWNFGGTAGWQNRRKAFVTNYCLDVIEWFDEDDEERDKLIDEVIARPWSPLMGVKLMLPMLNRAAQMLRLEGPTRQSLVLSAIACERHFLVKKSYPKTLAVLNLKFPLIDLTDPKKRDLGYQLGLKGGRPIIWSRAEEQREKNPKSWKLRWQFYEDGKK